MRTALWFAVFLTCLATLSFAQVREVRLAIGDKIRVVVLENEDYSGEYVVAADGTVTGNGFTRVAAAGRTLPEVTLDIKKQIERTLVRPQVFVYPLVQEPLYIYVAGTSIRTGTPYLRWEPGFDVRKLLAVTNVAEPFDRLEGIVYREGKQVEKFNVADAMRGKPGTFTGDLQPGDVVVFAAMPMIRVWFTQGFDVPGERQLPEGTTLAQGTASSRGPVTRPTPDPTTASVVRDQKIVVRRGDQVTEFRHDDEAGMNAFVLMSGDTISVRTPAQVSISVNGAVLQPGAYTFIEGTPLMNAITAAKGVTAEGTLRNIHLYRRGEMLTFDLSPSLVGGPLPDVRLEEGDILIVGRNERAIYVLGEVTRPGKYLMEDNKEIRTSDGLALAQGLSQRGTHRRAVLLRAGTDGKYKAHQFNLDEFLKDGKIESNPMMQPGDVLFFGTPKGIDTSAITQVLSSAILLQSLTGR